MKIKLLVLAVVAVLLSACPCPQNPSPPPSDGGTPPPASTCATDADCPPPTDCYDHVCGDPATMGPCNGAAGCVCVSMAPRACVAVSCAPSACVVAADCSQPPAGSGWQTVCSGGRCVREGDGGAACGGCTAPSAPCDPSSAITLCPLDAPCPAPDPGCAAACTDGNGTPIAWCCP